MYILYKPKDISLIYIITMSDTKTLKLFRKQAMATFELELNIWLNGEDFNSHDLRLYDFLTKAIKKKIKAAAYKKLKKEVEVLIKWGVLYDAFGYAILRNYGYETYLKLYQDLEGTHEVIYDVMTVATAQDMVGYI